MRPHKVNGTVESQEVAPHRALDEGVEWHGAVHAEDVVLDHDQVWLLQFPVSQSRAQALQDFFPAIPLSPDALVSGSEYFFSFHLHHAKISKAWID